MSEKRLIPKAGDMVRLKPFCVENVVLPDDFKISSGRGDLWLSFDSIEEIVSQLLKVGDRVNVDNPTQSSGIILAMTNYSAWVKIDFIDEPITFSLKKVKRID